MDRVGCRKIALPPRPEQFDIVSFIEDSISELEQAITTTRTEISLIREYRTRLVADVVTGQLDVRHLDLPEVEEQLIEELADSDLEELEEETDEGLED